MIDVIIHTPYHIVKLRINPAIVRLRDIVGVINSHLAKKFQPHLYKYSGDSQYFTRKQLDNFLRRAQSPINLEAIMVNKKDYPNTLPSIPASSRAFDLSTLTITSIKLTYLSHKKIVWLCENLPHDEGSRSKMISILKLYLQGVTYFKIPCLSPYSGKECLPAGSRQLSTLLEILKNISTFTYLEFQYTRFTDCDAELLAAMFQNHAALTQLVLDGGCITGQGAALLIKNLSKLESLNLNDQRIDVHTTTLMGALEGTSLQQLVLTGSGREEYLAEMMIGFLERSKSTLSIKLNVSQQKLTTLTQRNKRYKIFENILKCLMQQLLSQDAIVWLVFHYLASDMPDISLDTFECNGAEIPAARVYTESQIFSELWCLSHPDDKDILGTIYHLSKFMPQALVYIVLAYISLSLTTDIEKTPQKYGKFFEEAQYFGAFFGSLPPGAQNSNLNSPPSLLLKK